MSKKQRRKLTRKEKKLIKEVMDRAKKNGRQSATAQATIPYDRIWPDGICLAQGSRYTKTLQYQDINYQLAQNEDKTAIFDGWCDFLNCATRSRTNTIPQGIKLCGRLGHVVLKTGGSRFDLEATTDTLMSGMKG